MEASQFLKDEHKRIIGLLRQVRAATQRAPDMFLGINKEIVMELEIYFKIINEFVYSSISQQLSEKFLEINQSILNTLQKVKNLEKKDSKAVIPYLSELTSQVQECFSEEEHEIFPLLKGLSGELLRERQLSLLNLPEYADARPEVVQNPGGGEQMRKKSAA